MKSTPLALVILFIGSALVAVTPNASATVSVGVWQTANLGPHISFRVFEEWYVDGAETGGYFQWNTGDGAYGYLYGGPYISGVDGVGSLSDGRPFMWTVIGSYMEPDGTYGWQEVEISYDYPLPGIYNVEWWECCDYYTGWIYGQLYIQSDPLNPWFAAPPLPISLPGFQANQDGTCTVFDDAYPNGRRDFYDYDGDGQRDPDEPYWEEEYVTFPCTASPRVRNNADGSKTVYNDQDQDGQVGPGEEIFTTPANPDQDADGAPDALEAVWCAHENQYLESDGTCIGSDWSPPTAQGVVNDLEKLF